MCMDEFACHLHFKGIHVKSIFTQRFYTRIHVKCASRSTLLINHALLTYQQDGVLLFPHIFVSRER